MLNRKITRLKDYDYANPNWYYVTICTMERKYLFSKVKSNNVELNELGNIVESCWCEIPKHFVFVKLDYYIIMPNHIHGILIIEGRDMACHVPTIRSFGKPIPASLSTIIGSFKASVTRKFNLNKEEKIKIWQSRFYEHIIRNEIDLFNIRKYIQNNPKKWEMDEYYNSV